MLENSRPPGNLFQDFTLDQSSLLFITMQWKKEQQSMISKQNKVLIKSAILDWLENLTISEFFCFPREFYKDTVRIWLDVTET